VEVILLADHAAIVHLDIDEVGVDSIDRGAETLEEHGWVMAASVTDEGTGNREQGTG
jgi:hypothetical protein